MKYKYFTLLFLFFSFSYSQVQFEKGYIINKNNEVIECYIENKGWKNNPTNITYKLSIDSEKKLTANANSIIEFGIGNSIKYRSFAVKIDETKAYEEKKSNNPDPIFVQKVLFLKVLVNGKANLYYYEKDNLRRYFFSVLNHLEAIQLIYKEYEIDVIDGLNRVGYNNKFRKQLYDSLECSELTSQDFLNLDYFKKDLIEVFIKYNKCNGIESELTFENKIKGKINLRLKAGLSYSFVEVDNVEGFFERDLTSTEFDYKPLLRLGFELEYLLPINKNKWAVFVNPSYNQKYSEKSKITAQGTAIGMLEDVAVIDYSFFEVPIGVRHYMYLNNNKSKIFLDIAALVIIDQGDSKITYNTRSDLNINSGVGIVFGVGYNYDRFGLEIKSYPSRNILSNSYTNVRSYFNTPVSLSFSYNLL